MLKLIFLLIPLVVFLSVCLCVSVLSTGWLLKDHLVTMLTALIDHPHPPLSSTRIDINSTARCHPTNALTPGRAVPKCEEFLLQSGWVCIGCDNLCLQGFERCLACGAGETAARFVADRHSNLRQFFSRLEELYRRVILFRERVSIDSADAIYGRRSRRSRRSVRVSTCRRSDGAGGTSRTVWWRC